MSSSMWQAHQRPHDEAARNNVESFYHKQLKSILTRGREVNKNAATNICKSQN